MNPKQHRKYVRTAAAAEYIGSTQSTLEKWRVFGNGPILQVRKKCRLRPRRLGRVAQCPPPHFNVRHRVICSFWGLMSHAKKHRARWLVLEPHGRGFGRVFADHFQPEKYSTCRIGTSDVIGTDRTGTPLCWQFGNVGFWIPACPLCGGYEHTHTCCPGVPPLIRAKRLNGETDGADRIAVRRRHRGQQFKSCANTN